MKKPIGSFLFICLVSLIFGPAVSFAQKIVLNKTQVPALTIPDSLDISQNFYYSINRSEKFTQFNHLIGIYISLATDSLKKGKDEVAERIMMQDAIPMLSRYGDGFNMFHSFMTLGKSYTQQKKYTQAKWFFIQSNTISQKIGYRPGELFSLIELAKVKEAINDNKLALDDYRAAAVLATKINFTVTLVSIRKSIQKLTLLAKANDVPVIVETTPVLQALKN